MFLVAASKGLVFRPYVHDMARTPNATNGKMVSVSRFGYPRESQLEYVVLHISEPLIPAFLFLFSRVP